MKYGDRKVYNVLTIISDALPQVIKFPSVRKAGVTISISLDAGNVTRDGTTPTTFMKEL